jgi:hypothetical protein
MNRKVLLLLIAGICFINIARAQNKTEKSEQHFLQFSGVVLDEDSLKPIPFVSVLIKGTRRGTVSDYYGFFSLVVSPGDEVEFSSLIYKPRGYKVSDTLRQKYYYAIQVLAKDTVQLKEVEVFPWPSKEDFRRAFLALDLKDTDAERADKNLGREDLSYLERTQGASASENYKYVMQSVYTKVYTAGQSPEMTLLNPLRWAQFIDSWRKKNRKK